MIIATELLSPTRLYNIFKREVIDACNCKAAARLLFRNTDVVNFSKDFIQYLIENDSVPYEKYAIDLQLDDAIVADFGYDFIDDFERNYRAWARSFEDMWFSFRCKTFDITVY